MNGVAQMKYTRKPPLLRRYYTLIRRISNWPRYWAHRLPNRENSVYRFRTRGGGFILDVPDQLMSVFKGLFMRDEYNIDSIIPRLGPEPIVVDVGANAGYFSFLVLSNVPAARIYAFEPFPPNYELLQKNVEQNPQSLERIATFPHAVGGEGQTNLRLYYSRDDRYSFMASSDKDLFGGELVSIDVEVLSLPDIMNKQALPRIDLLKLDCEGSEFDILLNTPQRIFDRIGEIVLEVHESPAFDRSRSDLASFLQSMGYAIDAMSLTDRLSMMWASKQIKTSSS